MENKIIIKVVIPRYLFGIHLPLIKNLQFVINQPKAKHRKKNMKLS